LAATIVGTPHAAPLTARAAHSKVAEAIAS
jgi:hypothetical protein